MAQGKKHVPSSDTRAQVAALVGFGITETEISTFLNIAPPTLRLHYRTELDSGTISANMRVAKSLFDNAVKNNNVAAQIFWMKTRAGWRETVRVETAPPAPNVDVEQLSDATLNELISARMESGSDDEADGE